MMLANAVHAISVIKQVCKALVYHSRTYWIKSFNPIYKLIYMTFWKPHRGGFMSGFIWLFYWERLLSIMKPGIGSVRKQYLSWDICFLFYITIYRNCLRLEGRSSKTKEKGRNAHTYTYAQPSHTHMPTNRTLWVCLSSVFKTELLNTTTCERDTVFVCVLMQPYASQLPLFLATCVFLYLCSLIWVCQRVRESGRGQRVDCFIIHS